MQVRNKTSEKIFNFIITLFSRYVCTTDTCSGDVELTCTSDGTWQGGNLPSCDSKSKLELFLKMLI